MRFISWAHYLVVWSNRWGVKIRPNKNINNYKVKLIMRIRLIRRNKEKVLSILWERGSCKVAEKRKS